MLKTLQLTNFRGFEQLELKQLNRVNLIVGDNNTGKTSILEALYLLYADSKQLKDYANAFRATSNSSISGSTEELDRFWKWLFRNHTIYNSISIKAALDSSQPFEIRFFRDEDTYVATCTRTGWHAPIQMLNISNDGVIDLGYFASPGPSVRRLSTSHSNPSEDAELYNKVVVQAGGEEAIDHFLKIAESRLKKLRYLKLEGESDPLIYAQVGDIPELVPSTQLGQAFARILHIFCEVKGYKPGLFLADEIDNGIYHQNLPRFWQSMLELSNDVGTQIVATTHSFECMKAAHQAACERADKNGGNYDLNIIRLDRVDWGIRATEFGRETMEVAIAKGWEMR